MTRSTRWGGVLLVLLSAAFAAVLAHIGIDVFGDYLLPHDTYDDVAHGSRTALSCTALAGLATVAMRLLFGLLDEVQGGSKPPVDDGILTGSRGRFALFASAVAGLTLLCLAGMEAVDLRAAGRAFDDVADLLGGSLWLGLGLTLPFATSVAWVAWRIARWAASVRAFAVRAASALLFERTRRALPIRVSARYALRPTAREARIARRVAKRGPPLRRL